MKHVGQVSRNLPLQAMSAAEIDGMTQKIGRLVTVVTSTFACMTAGWNFWLLVTKD